MLIARDGAVDLVEVQLRTRRRLAALGRMGDEALRAAARYQASLARDRAEAGLTLAADDEFGFGRRRATSEPQTPRIFAIRRRLLQRTGKALRA